MRKPRRIEPAAKYHVIAKANRGEFILRSTATKELLFRTIAQAKAKYTFAVEHFCIMDNHVHLIVYPLGDGNLSRIMQWVLGVFAMRFNRMQGVSGHVWHDRFKSKVIDDIRQYLATFTYISRNPVVAGISRSETAYAYCGVRHMRDGRFEVVEPPGLLIRLLVPEAALLLLPEPT